MAPGPPLCEALALWFEDLHAYGRLEAHSRPAPGGARLEFVWITKETLR
jgi:hypothetical protein